MVDWPSVLSFFGSHLSLTGVLGAVLALTLVGIRKARLPADHPVKRFASPAVTGALLPVGVLQMMTAFAYGIDAFQGERPVTNSLVATAFLALIFLSGFNNMSQIGRKVPWAVIGGAGTAVLGGGAIWQLANGNSVTTLPALGGAGFIAVILYVAMFFLIEPWDAALRAAGNFTAFSPIMIGLQVPTAVLSILAAMGVVVL
jgi:hypothetical protein